MVAVSGKTPDLHVSAAPLSYARSRVPHIGQHRNGISSPRAPAILSIPQSEARLAIQEMKVDVREGMYAKRRTRRGARKGAYAKDVVLSVLS